MASGFKNFLKGIGLIPNSSTENTTRGDVEYLSSDLKLHVHNGSSNEAVVTETSTATLENKSLDDSTTAFTDSSDPTIQVKIDASGTASTSTTITSSQTVNQIITLPDATDTLIGKDTTDTLTNKSIDGVTNTFTNIPNAALDNDSITINGATIALGGSDTITANTTNALTIGTGLSGTSFDGSAPVTIAIDSTVATLTGSQTLSNKTLTSPIINTATADTITGIAGGPLTIKSAIGQDVLLQNDATLVTTVDPTGLTMASGKNIVLANNSQTVTLIASASASASYTITTPAAAPTASTALVYDGSNFVWGQAGGWSVGSSLSLTGGSSLTISATQGQQVYRVASSSGAISLSTLAPFSTTPSDGATIRLIGTSDTNTVQLTNSDTTSGCLLNGNAILASGHVIELQHIVGATPGITNRFYEIFRNF